MFSVFSRHNQVCFCLRGKKKFVIANQLMRSGTSIGANVHEAQNPESRADFIHKLKIAAKEADETEYWLLLCKFAESYPFQEELLDNLQNIKRIINRIINTAKTMPDCSVESLIPLIGAANHSLAHWHIGILAYLKDYERRNYHSRIRWTRRTLYG